MRRLVTLLAALSLLALPAGALAQSAGDEQYNDPFGEVEEPSGSQEEPQQAPEPAPAPAEPSASGEEVTASQETAAPSLPRTGLPAVLVVGAGALLLAGGTTLRRRVS
jgi:hypothetical protein